MKPKTTRNTVRGEKITNLSYKSLINLLDDLKKDTQTPLDELVCDIEKVCLEIVTRYKNKISTLKINHYDNNSCCNALFTRLSRVCGSLYGITFSQPSQSGISQDSRPHQSEYDQKAGEELNNHIRALIEVYMVDTYKSMGDNKWRLENREPMSYKQWSRLPIAYTYGVWKDGHIAFEGTTKDKDIMFEIRGISIEDKICVA